MGTACRLRAVLVSAALRLLPLGDHAYGARPANTAGAVNGFLSILHRMRGAGSLYRVSVASGESSLVLRTRGPEPRRGFPKGSNGGWRGL